MPYFIAFSASKIKSNINKDDLEGEFNYENLIFNKSRSECVNKLKETKKNSSNMISIIQPGKNQNKIYLKQQSLIIKIISENS